jgi:hypothetical protein
LGIAGSRNRSWRHMTLEDILEAVVPLTSTRAHSRTFFIASASLLRRSTTLNAPRHYCLLTRSCG